jgi:hypothetical protein
MVKIDRQEAGSNYAPDKDVISVATSLRREKRTNWCKAAQSNKRVNSIDKAITSGNTNHKLT